MASMTWDRLIVDCRLATMIAGTPYGAIENGALLIRDGRIDFAGAAKDLPFDAWRATKIIDRLDGRWVTPGLIDCHTHLVFGGNRVAEFEARAGGTRYEDIAREGGGILSTVRATRASSEEDLIAGAQARLGQMMREGLTTVEIKSGYGLDRDTELRMLSAARALGRHTGVRVHATYLGLHTLPPESVDDRATYVRFVAEDMLPAIAHARLADSVDAFLESIAFMREEVATVFNAAKKLRMPIRLHADQLCNGGGAALAAEYRALSADHLEYTDEDGVRALAKAGTVAVLLPGAFVFLRETQLPPIEALRRHGVPIAIATDCNPGSSPLLSPLMAMNLACAAFHLTPEEALVGFTRNAARALGLANEIGTLEAGKCADFAVWSIERPSELSYWMGGAPLWRCYAKGQPLQM